MEKLNHIIQKQVLEVEMENPVDAFQFRNRLGEVYNEKILPQLEDLFDEIGTAGKLIRVDKLHVDIGNISSKDWETTLANKIISEVRQLLYEQNVLWNKPLASIPEELDEDSIKIESPQTHFKYSVNADQPINQALNEFEDVLLFFLKNGRLPWYVSRTFHLTDLLNRSFFPDAIKILNIYLENADKQVFIRLIYQVDESSLDDLIEKLLAHHQSIFFSLFIKAKHILKDIAGSLLLNKQLIKKALYLPFFTTLYSNEESDFAKLFANKFTIGLMENFPEMVYRFTSELNLVVVNNNSILRSIKEFFVASSTSFQNLTERQFSNQTVIPDKLTLSQSFSNTAKQKNEQISFKMKEEEAVEIYIDNAGLVLLHPFLLPLFNQLKITVNDCYTNEYAKMKAVLLSQFLVNGEVVFEEHQLILNKILCGFPIDEPIFNELEITEEERNEVVDLLNQIILLWTKNNNQVNGSTAGMQQSFLQRPGKLINKGDDWQLQVEQRAYDMLLSSLPWGFGIVKTNWMKGMLRVDWA